VSQGSVVFTHGVVAGTSQLHNGLGAEGFFPLPTAGAGQRAATGSAQTLERLLSTLQSADPVATLRTHKVGASAGAGADLFAAAVITSNGVVLPGATVAVSVAHAWWYPHFYWYRDVFDGTDDGVRYAQTYRVWFTFVLDRVCLCACSRIVLDLTSAVAV
jgi:hypothetical protein